MKNQRSGFQLNLRHLLLFLLFLILMISNSSAQKSEENIFPLPIGKIIEYPIKNSEMHVFPIELRQNGFLRIDVKEKGFDLRVGLFRLADKKIIGTSNYSYAYGRELLTCLIEKTSTYFVLIEGQHTNFSGNYEMIASLVETATEKEKRLIKAENLLFEGFVDNSTPEKLKNALEKWEEALQIWAKLDEKYWMGFTANLLGLKYYSSYEKQKALEYYSLALPLFRNTGDKDGEAKTLSNIGLVYSDWGEKSKALECFNQVLDLIEVIGNSYGKAVTLNSIGLLYLSLGENQTALYYFDQALQLNREIQNQNEEALTLNNIGAVYLSLARLRNAVEYFNQALEICRLTGNKIGEATVINNIGKVSSDLGEKQKALTYYKQSLLIDKQIDDTNGEATTLANVGEVYYKFGERQKALQYFGQSLSLVKTTGNRIAEAKILNNIGSVFSSLGDQQKALELFNQGLAIKKQTKDVEGEALAYNSIGQSYMLKGDIDKALEFYNRALTIREKIGDVKGTVYTLINIGQAYLLSNSLEKSLEYSDKALKLSEQLKYKIEEASILNNIGVTYHYAGKNQEAAEYYKKALLLTNQIDDKQMEATILSNMTDVWNLLGNQRSAIFLGQMTVDKYQRLRGFARSSEIDNGVQKSFLSRVKNHYKYLTELLIKQEQPEKAVQILNLYQNEQFFDFDWDSNSPVRQTTISFRQKQLVDLYENSAKKIYDINSQITERDWKLPSLESSKQKQKNLESLKIEFKSATDNFLNTLERAKEEFAQKPDEKDKIPPIKDVIEMQSVLQQLNSSTKQETAVLYTLIGEKKFYVLLITARGDVKVFESPIDKQELNWKLIQFYALLQRPAYDPRILGEELYKTIIPQKLDDELKKQKIQTLMWQLDGNLRYIPVAALWDGEKYLVEKYQNVVLTRADLQRLLKEAKPDWTGTGFGSSEAHQIDLLKDGRKIPFSGLPSTRKELTNIFFTDDNEQGILKGEVYINKDFTKERFYEAMKKRRQVVHISSHFRFYPGDSSLSFLVLGDGEALTLNEMKDHKNLFEGVELLTLSACETGAVLPNADGREIDGFAELAQRLGANAVMASLWRAREYGTANLMAEFYSNRQKKKLSKAESLRLAQLSLIRGNNGNKTQTDTEENLAGTGVGGNLRGDDDPAYSIDKIVVDDKYLKAFETDKKTKPFAHPYHWAPFVLFGNWK